MTLPIKNIPVGQILVETKKITQEQLNIALNIQSKDSKKRLGDILIQLGYVTEKELARALEARLKVPFVDLSELAIDPDAPGLLPEELARKYGVIPVSKSGKTLTVATADPMNFYALDDLRLSTNMDIKVVLSTQTEIKNAISHFYSRMQAEEAAEDINKEFTVENIDELYDQLGDKIDNAPVVRLVNLMIQQAVKLGASDIHIEPGEQATRVRMRVDGVLQDQMKIAIGAHNAVITRLKIMGGMNIAEKRLPQDGRVEMNVEGRAVDLRLSSLPTVSGEKMVLRVLGGSGSMITRSEIGMSKENERLFDQIMRNQNGIVLVSGPTGSGKTTLLYSLLDELNRPDVNIITIEDPVEYRIQGINQVQINPKAGLTFAGGLRSILRQDPDIIMVGEIRDPETAQIAVRAAITGHLVLSTIHTNDAASTVSRLIDMSVEPYLVSSGLIGIVAQRLVRKICPRCKTPYQPSKADRELLRINDDRPIYVGSGCNYCNHTGFKGRTAIHEIIPVTKAVRELIDKNATADEIRDYTRKNGTVSLMENCISLVLDGTTTVGELLKVAYNAEL